MKLEFYPEMCCEFCNEVIHNHFHCPVCNDKYAGTTIYGSIMENFTDCFMIDTSFSCQECKTTFEVITDTQEDVFYDEWEWKIV